jgi:DNA-binding winged helix-turn-helix (wHTH) protein
MGVVNRTPAAPVQFWRWAVRLRYALFEFDPDSGEVFRDGVGRRLEPQPAALLALLARRHGELVPSAEIRRTLWGDGTHVDFRAGLSYCVRQIRLAVGDDAREPRILQTMPRRGYRFIAEPAAALPSPAAAGAPRRRRLPGQAHPAAAAGLLTVAILAAVLLESRPNRHHELTVAALRAIHSFLFESSADPR